jgi:hypothetical protein
MREVMLGTTFLRFNLSIWTLRAVCLLTASLCLTSPPPGSGKHHNLLPWLFGHQVFFNAVSYLSNDQFVCVSSHQDMSKYLYKYYDVGTLYFESKILDIWKFTALIPLSLLISFKPPFPIVGLKKLYLPTLALKSTSSSWVALQPLWVVLFSVFWSVHNPQDSLDKWSASSKAPT